ncbi:MAG: hypothetical protein GEU75_06195 [Dehalococcoidia bacterium]|nr:hypothetical protein [Dehalococcoidia bacterium]
MRQPVYSRGHLGHFVLNVWRHHELLRHLMIRDIKAQYKQSMLGYAWILLNPICQLAIMSFVFTTALRPSSQGDVPFSLFLAVGLLPWIFFANATTSATMSITSGPNLIKSVYFPREMLVIASVLVRLVDLAAGLLIVGALMVAHGQPVLWTVVWMPLLVAIHVMFVVGLSLPLAALNLFFRDVRFLVATAIALWFFLTPIFYSLSAVPERYRLIYDLNPNARLIQAYRWALFEGVSPPIESVLWAFALSGASLVLGYYVFKRMEPYFADFV